MDYVSTLADRAKDFPPAIEALFTRFVVVSKVLVDQLLGPDQGIVTDAQCQAIHQLHIWACVALFGRENPGLREACFAACEEFIGASESEKQLVEDILAMQEIDLQQAGSLLHTAITPIVGETCDDPYVAQVLVGVFENAYSAAVDGYEHASTR